MQRTGLIKETYEYDLNSLQKFNWFDINLLMIYFQKTKYYN